jgi:predicted homoserine dehydrogenase-like protein
MNLHKMLAHAEAEKEPVLVGLIGAGKFGTMFLAQARLTLGIQILGIADLDVERAKQNCVGAGWSDEQLSAPDLDTALRTGATHVGDDAMALINNPDVDVIIEATGNPKLGIAHALAAIGNRKHVIMVNVEADVLAGPLLARCADSEGVIYSLAWGDQPALICEHVDWARACGFGVVCAGKGTRYHPDFHQSTPDTVWDNFHFGRETAERGGMNPKMFNSFIDGTKSAIEMSAVCNATSLTPQPGGLKFTPCSHNDLAEVLKPESAGGTVSHVGTTEVVSSLNRDMTPVENDLMLGTYVVIEGDNDYVRHCFEEYRMLPDSTHHYAALYRPTHMIGLELGISVASVVLRGEATGSATGFRSDVVATAKRPLKAGEILDGEGGYMVWGKQMPARASMQMGGLPLGLACEVKLTRDIAEGEQLTWADADIDEYDDAVVFRREMEGTFRRVAPADPADDADTPDDADAPIDVA